MKKILFLTILISTIFLTSCFNKSKQVDVYFIGSVQGYYKNFSNLKSFLDANKTTEKLILSSGDYFSETPEGIYSRGQNIFTLLSIADIDATGIFSEDLEFGWDNIEKNIKKKTVSVISSNVSNDLLKKYYIKEISGIKFGVLSIMSNQKLKNFEPKKLDGLKIENEILNIKDKADIVILISPKELVEEKLLDKKHGIDIILTNNTSGKDDFYQKNGVYVASCENQLKQVCELKIKVKKSKKIRKIYYEKHNLQDVVKDADFEKFIGEMYTKINKKLDRKIAKTEINFSKSATTDKLAHCISKVYGRPAIMSSKIVKSDLSQGDISLRNVYQILPQENHTILLDIKGKQLKKALQKTLNSDINNWPSISGLQIEYIENSDGTKELIKLKRNGINVSDNWTYRLAVSDDIFRGSLGHDEFLNMVELKKTYKPISELLTWCFRSERKVYESKNAYKKINQKIKIGNLTLKNNLFLAPLAGITDSPFRKMCLKGGAGLVWAEMVSSQALKYENQRSEKMLFIDKDEHPVAMQIFGSDLESIEISTKKSDEFGADIIDINAGCPMKKILKSNSGAALMYDEVLLGKIIATAVKSTKKPITLKTRIGIKQGQITGDKLAQIAEQEGASAVCIHARYVSQIHSGNPDLDALAKVCSSVKIPVIANGGIQNYQTAQKMFETGTTAIMIGRGAIGNPSIFQNIIETDNGKIPKPLTLDNQLKLFLKLVESNAKYYGERMGILRSRKVVSYWIRGFEKSAIIRQNFMDCTTLDEVRQLISEMIS